MGCQFGDGVDRRIQFGSGRIERRLVWVQGNGSEHAWLASRETSRPNRALERDSDLHYALHADAASEIEVGDRIHRNFCIVEREFEVAMVVIHADIERFGHGCVVHRALFECLAARRLAAHKGLSTGSGKLLASAHRGLLLLDAREEDFEWVDLNARL